MDMAKYRLCPRCGGKMEPDEKKEFLVCVKKCGGLVKLPDKVA